MEKDGYGGRSRRLKQVWALRRHSQRFANCMYEFRKKILTYQIFPLHHIFWKKSFGQCTHTHTYLIVYKYQTKAYKLSFFLPTLLVKRFWLVLYVFKWIIYWPITAANCNCWAKIEEISISLTWVEMWFCPISPRRICGVRYCLVGRQIPHMEY